MAVGQWYPTTIGKINMLAQVDATAANQSLIEITYYKPDGSAPDARVKPPQRWTTYTGAYYDSAADASAART